MEQEAKISSKSPKILLTGLPGCGKTTAIMQILEKLKGKNTAGFYTQEIREGNTRKGFRFNRLDGHTGILAHINIKTSYRVGKYRVNLEEFEKVIVPVLNPEDDAQIFIIDEIGKMECFSGKFESAVRRLFDSDKTIIATVAQKGDGLISEIKNHPAARLFNLTIQNQDSVVNEIIKAIIKSASGFAQLY
jgi:nucleoside-triphosphatase